MLRYQHYEIRPIRINQELSEKYELVFWNKDFTSCIMIAILEHNKDFEWNLNSCGFRLLEYYNERLLDYIQTTTKLIEICESEDY